jgi:NAD+ kinase
VVVAKRSAYSRYVEEEGDPRARALLRRRDPSVSHWMEAHKAHMRTLEEVDRILGRLGARAVLVNDAHATFDTADARLVIAVGGDGTLLAASHNVGSVPILGVNSAPRHSVGFFCAATRKGLEEMLEQAFEGHAKSILLTRMAVIVNGRVRSRRVLNEALYCHTSPAATSRYILRHRRVREEQRSSGFWIGPAAGSTAAQRSAGGKVLPLGSKKLQLVVREPYAPFNRRYRLLRVLVDPGTRVVAQSQMQEACMFLDGPYKVIDVRLGDETEFRASDEPLRVLGLGPRRHRVE